MLDPKHERAFDIIEENFTDVKHCCRKMFSKWLETRDDATWNQLIEAVRTIELNEVSSNIEQLENTSLLQVSTTHLEVFKFMHYHSVISIHNNTLYSPSQPSLLSNHRFYLEFHTEKVYILYFTWGGGGCQSDAKYRIVHTVLINCMTVLHESYTTVMQLIGQIQYSYALNQVNTAHLGNTVQLC